MNVHRNNDDIIDVHTVQSVLSRTSTPFSTAVQLVDSSKRTAYVTALVDDGAMVAAIDVGIYRDLEGKIGGWGPPRRRMRMADGRVVPAIASWSGSVRLKGIEVEGSFEVFDSGGSWSLLFGKPLLEKFKAVHEYEGDTIHITNGKEVRTIFNEKLGKPVQKTKSEFAAMVEDADEDNNKDDTWVTEEDKPTVIKEKACALGGVSAKTDTPLDREVNSLPFANEEKIPTDILFNTEKYKKRDTTYHFVFETPSEYQARRRQEDEEKQARLAKIKEMNQELDKRREKAFRKEQGRLWKGKSARRWGRWKNRGQRKVEGPKGQFRYHRTFQWPKIETREMLIREAKEKANRKRKNEKRRSKWRQRQKETRSNSPGGSNAPPSRGVQTSQTISNCESADQGNITEATDIFLTEPDENVDDPSTEPKYQHGNLHTK
ncbi:hypothetical protein VKT23_012373 [Stygiomarasmius scandens]|uniref:Uncharacterized protein n=1 Tax=Marasmiellus scandens TaxID=2682957 RepID=A0ABR1JAI9_9AGAR